MPLQYAALREDICLSSVEVVQTYYPVVVVVVFVCLFVLGGEFAVLTSPAQILASRIRVGTNMRERLERLESTPCKASWTG